MKIIIITVTLLAISMGGVLLSKADITNHPAWVVYFSPQGGCTEAIISEINGSSNNILVQAYSFTSDSIGRALLGAHKRGIKVRVILDKSQRREKYSSADFMAHAGIETLIDSDHAIAHNKVMIIDGATVITGSFNFTKAAEMSNAENLLIIRDCSLAEKYSANWASHATHSALYKGK